MKSLSTILWLLLGLIVTSPAWADEFRESNLKRLTQQGFKAASSLPEGGTSARKLRPRAEIEARLKALRCLVLWVASSDPAKAAPFRQQAREKYLAWLTKEELAMLELEQGQAHARYLDSIGWQMENMWALAWVLGFETEPALRGQIQGDLARDLVFRFSDRSTFTPRSSEEVIKMEDYFYCAHNAVRSAQKGGTTVPQGYDPVEEGGGVHERRHALTWCLSPGVSWDDTDLST